MDKALQTGRKEYSYLYYHVRRLLQILFCILALVISLPLIVVASLAIKCSSSGPIFYRGKRVGRNREIYTIYKFRTMYVGTEAKVGGRLIRREEADQITKVGRILRKCKLDELSQLINILKGEMNFVGPRPIRPALLESYLKDYPDYTKRFAVKPGITGLAQIRGGYYIHPRRKLRYDLFYIQKRGLWVDLKIIIITIYLVFKRMLPRRLYELLTKLRYMPARLRERGRDFRPICISELSDDSELALLARQQARYTIRKLERLTKRGHQRADIFYYLGIAHMMNGQRKKACVSLEKAAKLEANYVQAYYQLGLLFYKQRRYKEAISYLERANASGPENANVFYLLGLCHEALGSSEKAGRFYGKAIIINPDCKQEVYALKQDYIILIGNHIPVYRILRCLEIEIDRNPGHADLYNMLGLIYVHLGQVEAAMEAFSSVLKIFPHHTDAKISLGQCFSERGEFGTAIRMLEAAIQEKPDDANIHIQLGTLYAQNGNQDRAAVAFKEALHIDPHHEVGRIQLKLLRHHFGWETDST